MASGTEVMELLVQLVGQLAEARSERDEERRRCADFVAAAEDMGLDINRLVFDVNRLEHHLLALEIEVEAAHDALSESRTEVEASHDALAKSRTEVKHLRAEVEHLRSVLARGAPPPSDKRNMT